ncbi:MAG TPA: hypothetical protein PK109_01530 [Candidatus Paceibacterota bacterium]|nr:hypothetical protein [Candidatus Paceibacterota bacterium]
MAKKDAAASLPEEMDADHAELRVYELGFHIDPELGTEEVKKTYQAIRTLAEAGSIVAEGEPTKIPLAYTISRSETSGRRDFDSSFFAWIAYEATGEGHNKVLEAAGADKRIFRFLDIRTDKEAAKHSAEMHEIMAKMEPVETEEEVSDAELDAALKEVA